MIIRITIHHLLTNCIYERQFWFSLLEPFGLQALAPSMEDALLEDWCSKASILSLSYGSGALDTLQT
jgi:hypothetical protein